MLWECSNAWSLPKCTNKAVSEVWHADWRGLTVLLPSAALHVFAGEQFENNADFKLAKSMLLDMFRGRVVEKINLKVYSPWRHYMAPPALT